MGRSPSLYGLMRTIRNLRTWCSSAKRGYLFFTTKITQFISSPVLFSQNTLLKQCARIIVPARASHSNTGTVHSVRLTIQSYPVVSERLDNMQYTITQTHHTLSSSSEGRYMRHPGWTPRMFHASPAKSPGEFWERRRKKRRAMNQECFEVYMSEDFD